MPRALLPAPCSQSEIKKIFRYDPQSGELIHLQHHKQMKPGMVAGYFDKATGYGRVKIFNKNYMLHKVIWFLVTGEWIEVDHRNCDGTNNAWLNLRKATTSNNNANRRRFKNNSTGFKGVCIKKTRTGIIRYRACIQIDKKFIILGHFDTPEKAAAVYQAAALHYFGEFSNFTDQTAPQQKIISIPVSPVFRFSRAYQTSKTTPQHNLPLERHSAAIEVF